MTNPSTDYPLCSHSVRVEPEWVDYNGHLTESRYLHIFSDATDELFKYIGVDQDYRDRGRSYFTVETYIAHRGEAAVDEQVRVTTELHGFDDKRIHLLHKMFHQDRTDLLAQCEQILLHVDLNKRRASVAQAGVLEKLKALRSLHLSSVAGLPDQALILGQRMKKSRDQAAGN